MKSNPFGIVGPKESREYTSEVRFEDIVTRRELLVKRRLAFHRPFTKDTMTSFKEIRFRGGTCVIKATRNETDAARNEGVIAQNLRSHFLASIGRC